MRVTEVLFKRNYAISPLTMEHMHLSATVVVEEGETASDALKLAQKTVEDFYTDACSKSVASEYEQSTPVVQVKGNPLSDEIQVTLDGINSCELLEGKDGLKFFWIRSKSNLILSTAYKAKEKQLTDAK